MLLVLSIVWLLPSGGRAQQSTRPKHVLVLYWDEKDHPANEEFERYFQAAVRSAASGPVEFYSEFLESSRFPGKSQSKLLHDYIRKKYAGRTIDVVVPNATAPLDFLFKYRGDLLPHTPIVFAATTYPSAAQLQVRSRGHWNRFCKHLQKNVRSGAEVTSRYRALFIVSGTRRMTNLRDHGPRSAQGL